MRTFNQFLEAQDDGDWEEISPGMFRDRQADNKMIFFVAGWVDRDGQPKEVDLRFSGETSKSDCMRAMAHEAKTHGYDYDQNHGQWKPVIWDTLVMTYDHFIEWCEQHDWFHHPDSDYYSPKNGPEAIQWLRRFYPDVLRDPFGRS